MRLESPPRLITQFTEPRNRPRDLAMVGINRVRTLAIDEALTQSPLLIFKGKKQQHWR